MGISCRPVGKLASVHKKVDNQLSKEREANKKLAKSDSKKK